MAITFYSSAEAQEYRKQKLTEGYESTARAEGSKVIVTLGQKIRPQSTPFGLGAIAVEEHEANPEARKFVMPRPAVKHSNPGTSSATNPAQLTPEEIIKKVESGELFPTHDPDMREIEQGKPGRVITREQLRELLRTNRADFVGDYDWRMWFGGKIITEAAKRMIKSGEVIPGEKYQSVIDMENRARALQALTYEEKEKEQKRAYEIALKLAGDDWTKITSEQHKQGWEEAGKERKTQFTEEEIQAQVKETLEKKSAKQQAERATWKATSERRAKFSARGMPKGYTVAQSTTGPEYYVIRPDGSEVGFEKLHEDAVRLAKEDAEKQVVPLAIEVEKPIAEPITLPREEVKPQEVVVEAPVLVAEQKPIELPTLAVSMPAPRPTFESILTPPPATIPTPSSEEVAGRVKQYKERMGIPTEPVVEEEVGKPKGIALSREEAEELITKPELLALNPELAGAVKETLGEKKERIVESKVLRTPKVYTPEQMRLREYRKRQELRAAALAQARSPLLTARALGRTAEEEVARIKGLPTRIGILAKGIKEAPTKREKAYLGLEAAKIAPELVVAPAVGVAQAIVPFTAEKMLLPAIKEVKAAIPHMAKHVAGKREFRRHIPTTVGKHPHIDLDMPYVIGKGHIEPMEGSIGKNWGHRGVGEMETETKDITGYYIPERKVI